MKNTGSNTHDTIRRWEDFADGHVADARLTAYRSIAGLPHWALERPVGSIATAPQAAVRKPVGRSLAGLKHHLGEALRRIPGLNGRTRARRQAIRSLARMDDHLLRDIGLEARDIHELVTGTISLGELDARRFRHHGAGSGHPVEATTTAEVIVIRHQNDTAEGDSVRKAA